MKFLDKFNKKYLEIKNEAQAKAVFVDVFGDITALNANPTLSREQKLVKLREHLDRLSEEDFEKNLHLILSIIQRKKENCEKFKTVQEQVNSIYEIVPRLKAYSRVVYDTIRERRKSYGLSW